MIGGGGARARAVSDPVHFFLFCGAVPFAPQGALAGSSSPSACCVNPPCQFDIELDVSGDVQETFTLPGTTIQVSSVVTASINETFSTTITEPNREASFSCTLNAW